MTDIKKPIKSGKVGKTYLQPAGFLWRFFAHLIDLTFFVLLTWLLFNIFVKIYGFSDYDWLKKFGLTSLPTNQLIIASISILLLPISFLYFLCFEASPLKATPGKIIMGLYVIKADGTTASFTNIFVRTLARLLCVLSFGLGYVIAAFSSKKRALHDLVGNTTVINYGGIPTNMRIFSGTSAVVVFLVTFYLLPAMQLLPRFGDTDISDIEIELPKKEVPAYDYSFLSFANKTYQFHDHYGKVDTIKVTQPGSDKTLTYKRIIIAFYEAKLSSIDKQTLIRTQDFFKKTNQQGPQAAALTITQLFPLSAESCAVTTLSSLKLNINPQIIKLPYAYQNDSNIHLDLENINKPSVLSTNCSQIAARSEHKFEIKSQLPEKLATPMVNFHLQANTVLDAPIKANDLILNQLGTSIAFWKPTEQQLVLAFYTKVLNNDQIKKIASTNKIYQNEIASPAVVAEFSYPNKQEIFTRDLVRNYKVTFFRQAAGPLAFRANEASIQESYTADNPPPSLNGKIITGAGLIGRINGEKQLSSDEGSYYFKWDLPFNATIVVVE